MKAIRETAMTTVMIPSSRSKPSHAQMKVDDPWLAPLLAHLDLLLNLGEVCATRVVSTLVDGMQGHANRKGTIAHVYLPILMGYRSCCKPYMLLLGLHTRCAPDGAIIVDGVDSGKPSDHGYVSFSAYYHKWRTAYPQLKVSRPAEDICRYCSVFANRHRYLANHSAVAVADCSDNDEDEDDDDAAPPEEEAAAETEEAAVI